MEKLKKFLSGRGVGFYLTLPAVIMCIIAICLYSKNGVTSFNPELNKKAIAYIGAGIALCVVCVALDCADAFINVRALKLCIKPLKYVAYLLCLYAFMWFIYSQVTYIANVFVAIDGYTFTSGFIATVVMYVLSFVFVLLSAALNNWKPWAREKTTIEVVTE